LQHSRDGPISAIEAIYSITSSARASSSVGNSIPSAALEIELEPKRLQLIRALIPNAAIFGVLVDPAFPPTQSIVTQLQAAARTLGLQLIIMNAAPMAISKRPSQLFRQQRVGAVLVGNSAFFNRRTEQLAALAARHALPAIFQFREFVLGGGLMSYGSRFSYA